jgi:hypothetical protein
MYVRIARGNFDPAKEVEVHILGEVLLFALQALPDFQSFLGGLDRRAGRLVLITTWETE